MLTIALVAYRRPFYLKKVMEAIEGCQEFSTSVDRIVCSVDEASNRGQGCYKMLSEWNPGRPVQVLGHGKRRGIVGNTILAMKEAFDVGSQNVLMLEDDAVLSPDALRISRWFCEGDLPTILAFGLSAHMDSTEDDRFDAGAVWEYNFLPCPFAYVVKLEHWPFLLKNWCCKNFHPCGWSWSMTFAARKAGLRYLAPRLSRCKNIGRELGENESEASWLKSQTGHCYSNGDYQGKYSVRKTLSDEDARTMEDPWMQAELRQDAKQLWPSGDDWPGWLGFGCPKEIEEARKKLHG